MKGDKIGSIGTCNNNNNDNDNNNIDNKIIIRINRGFIHVLVFIE